LRLVFLKLSVMLLLAVLTEKAGAQGCSIVLKITNPASVCSPSTVDLTSDAVTAGSTNGLILSYYINSQLSIPVTSPTKVGAGTYFIKGTLTGYCAGFAVATVTVTVLEKPKVVIPNPVIRREGANVNLTLPQVTSGSDAGLIFSYWNNTESTSPFLTPASAGVGVYYIKGTATSGCSSIQSITVSD
jgi:hypothetical protein